MDPLLDSLPLAEEFNPAIQLTASGFKSKSFVVSTPWV